MSSLHDSAGVPWEGRSFSQNLFAGDSGDTPEAIARGLGAYETGGIAALFPYLAGQRVLVPLLAEKVGSEIGPHGLEVDAQADMAIVAIATPDQQSAVPVFGSVADLAAWRRDARPVPIEIARAALGAIAEGHRRLVLNPAGQAIGLRYPMMRALATAEKWLSPEANPKVSALVQAAVADVSAVQNWNLVANDPQGSLQKPELMIELTLRAGLTAEELDTTLRSLAERLQQGEWADLVDSFGFRLLVARSR